LTHLPLIVKRIIQLFFGSDRFANTARENYYRRFIQFCAKLDISKVAQHPLYFCRWHHPAIDR